MEYLPIKIPRKALEDISFELIPPETSEKAIINCGCSVNGGTVVRRE